MDSSCQYVFGEFCLDADQRALFRRGERVPLTPKSLETLLFLVERRGKIVEKKELMDAVWPDTFVEEVSLARNVSALRKILSPNEGGQSYIETIPKRGYRFVMPVGSGEVVRELKETPAEEPLSKQQSRTPWGWGSLVLFSLIVLLGAGVALYWWRLQERRNPPHKIALAVLPVQNLTGDASRDYISDGLTEELIATLGKMDPDQMAVIARTSSMAYKRTNKTVAEIGRELGADYVMEASVRGDWERFRFTVQLIRARDQTHLWVKDYDRTARDLLAVQDEIGRDVAKEIELRVTTSSPKGAVAPQHVFDSDAYRAYLLGRYHWNRGDEANLWKGIQYFESALAKDPENALAYAGLADSYSYLSDWYRPPREVMPKARAAAKKAVQLDESLPAAHNAVCFVAQAYDWDWDGAERECRRAIQLNPNYADAHDNYSMLLAYVGRQKDADAELTKAEELDPLSFRIYTDGEFEFFLARDYRRAEEQAKRAIELAPDYFLAHIYLALVYAQTGRKTEAVVEAEKGKSLTDSSLVEGFAGYTYAAEGKTAEARRIVSDLIDKRRESYVCAFEIGTILVQLGDRGEAFPWFEKAYEDRSLCVTSMKYDPRLDSIRDDPRYQSIVERVGFPHP